MLLTLQIACDNGSFWCDVRLTHYDGHELRPIVREWACDPAQLELRLADAMNAMALALAAESLTRPGAVIATLTE